MAATRSDHRRRCVRRPGRAGRHGARARRDASRAGRYATHTVYCREHDEHARRPTGRRPTRPPVADRRPVTTEHHGRTRTDDYDWLRAKDDPEVTAYLEAENAWTVGPHGPPRGPAHASCSRRSGRAPRRPTSRCRRATAAGGTTAAPSRVASTAPRAGSRSPTTPTGARRSRPRTATRTSPRCRASRSCSTTTPSPRTTTSTPWAASRSAPTAPCSPTPPTPWATSATCCEVKDLATGELLPDRIEGVLGGGVWSPDGRDLYYCTVDDSWRRDKVWRHRLGTAQADDELVLHETDERFWVGVGRSRTDRFLVAVVRLEEHLRDAASSTPTTPTPAGWCSTPARRGSSTASSTR